MNIEDIWKIYKELGFKGLEFQSLTSDNKKEFLNKLIWETVFKKPDTFKELWEELKPYPSLYGDSHYFKSRVDFARKRSAQLMMEKHPQVYERWGIEKTEIDKKNIHLKDLGADFWENGLHIVKGSIGSGKTSQILIPDTQRYGKKARLLICMPSKAEVYELTKKLGGDWKHYHHYGEKPEQIKKAFIEFNWMVTCTGSLRRFEELSEFINTYDCIWGDETAKLLKDYGKPKQAIAAYRESLETYFKLIKRAKRSVFLSADLSERGNVDFLGRLASEINQRAYFYKNNLSYQEGKEYIFFDDEWDLMWEVIDRLNAGQRGYGVMDFANRKKPLFNAMFNFMKRKAPLKKIHAFTAQDFEDGRYKALKLREQGFQEYIADETNKGNLDCIISSPFSSHNVSIIAKDIEHRMDFSFGFHRHINDADDILQDHGRDRDIRTHLVYINQSQNFPIWGNSVTKETPGQLEKEYLDNMDYGARMMHYCQRMVGHQIQMKRANKKRLVQLNLEEMGARILQGFINKDNRAKEYLEFRNEYQETVLDVEAESGAIESTAFNRRRLFSRFKEYDNKYNKWVQAQDGRDGVFNTLANVKEQISEETAERIFLISRMDEEEAKSLDYEFNDCFFWETKLLTEKIWQALKPTHELEGLARWWLEAPTGSIWYSRLKENQSDEIGRLLKNNYNALYRPTLAIEKIQATTMKNFLTKIIAKNLELEIWTTVTEERRLEWRTKLFEQYYKEWGGKVKRTGMNNAQRYEAIAAILREKVAQDGGQRFSKYERGMLDTMPDILKIRRPNRPIYSKIFSLYNDYLSSKDIVERDYCEALEKEIKRPPQKR